MLNKIFRVLFAIVLLAGQFVCFNGNADAGEESNRSAGKAMASLSTAGLQPGQLIAGIDVTINIPLGATVKTDPATGEVAKGVVQLSGAADPAMTFVQAYLYQPAEKTHPGSLQIMVVDAQGFGTGEFVQVHIDITPGYFPAPTDFKLTSFKADDQNGIPIPDLKPSLITSIIK